MLELSLGEHLTHPALLDAFDVIIHKKKVLACRISNSLIAHAGEVKILEFVDIVDLDKSVLSLCPACVHAVFYAVCRT